MSYSQALAGAVGWLTMDRPAAMNSLNREMASGLTAQLNAWRDDDAVRVVVITGNGRAFCAGADLIEAAEPAHPDKREFLELIVEFFDTLRAFPKPVIAAVNGLPRGRAGSRARVRCRDRRRFRAPRRRAFEFRRLSRRGRRRDSAAQGACQRRALSAFTGDSMSAAELKGYGLVNEVLADAELKPRAQALAEKLAKKKPARARAHEARGERSRRQDRRRCAAARTARASQSSAVLRRQGRTESIRRKARAEIPRPLSAENREPTTELDGETWKRFIS